MEMSPGWNISRSQAPKWNSPMLAEEENLAGLKAISRDLIAKAGSVDSQQRVVKTGGRLIKHARYCWLLLAESHLTRRLFGAMLHQIAVLPSPAG